MSTGGYSNTIFVLSQKPENLTLPMRYHAGWCINRQHYHDVILTFIQSMACLTSLHREA